MEYWLISAPGDKTCHETFETMNNLTSKQSSLSSNYKFHIPDLKVGTLDQLVGLSDDLGKLDLYVEQVTRKVATYLGEVLEDQRDKLHENLMANNSQTSMDSEATGSVDSVGEGGVGPDTPPNTPVTPGSGEKEDYHESSTEREQQRQHHRHHHHGCRHRRGGNGQDRHYHYRHHQEQYQQVEKHGQPNQSHHQHHHYHQSNHSHSSSSEKNRSSESCHISSDSMYSSCYHSHWCAASTTSTPSHSSSPGSSSLSFSFSSSSCSSLDESSCGGCTRSHTGHHHHHSHHQHQNEQHQQQQNRRHRYQRHADSDRRRQQRRAKQRNKRHKEPVSVDEDLDSLSQEPEPSGNYLKPGDLPTYITRFQWDMAKYPIKQSLRNIADIIGKQVGQIDADLKTKSTTYNNLKGNLQNLEKKQTGSLLTRNLADLVKKDHFILDSEYLTTLLVIVPRASIHDWNIMYEKLTDMIVPRSSQLITQDSDYGLFTVTLFKKVIEEFKLHAREKKFIVRDFTYNEEELAAGKHEMTKLVTDKKKQFGPLVRWLKVNFSECFCAWIHVKALRVFVESVLRYGLPVNFQAMLLRPHKKSTKRLRDVLNQLYAHLDSSTTGGNWQLSSNDSVDIPGLGFGQTDYYPYVYYKINIDMIDSKV